MDRRGLGLRPPVHVRGFAVGHEVQGQVDEGAEPGRGRRRRGRLTHVAHAGHEDVGRRRHADVVDGGVGEGRRLAASRKAEGACAGKGFYDTRHEEYLQTPTVTAGF